MSDQAKLYENQEVDIEISVRVRGLTLSDATGGTIEYRTPSGVEGSWAATLLANKLSCTLEADDAERGTWVLQPILEFPGSRYVPGTSVPMVLHPRFS